MVGVAGFGRDPRGGVTVDQAVDRMVEADQAGGPFGSEAQLAAEAGPQALAAPAEIGGELLDAESAVTGHDSRPGPVDLGVRVAVVA